MQKKELKKYLIIVIIFLIAIFGSLIYFNLRNTSQPSETVVSTGDLMTRLGSIMILPDEQNPKIAVISDIDTLKSQDADFYKNALNGDTLIIYTKIIIIYRSSENKIVNVAPIDTTKN